MSRMVEILLHEFSSTYFVLYFQEPLGNLNLINVIIDLFIAGSETTSTTLNFAMLYMILNPDVQNKVRSLIPLQYHSIF